MKIENAGTVEMEILASHPDIKYQRNTKLFVDI